MRALLRIEGDDGSVRTVACRARSYGPAVRVELDCEESLEAGIAYHIVLLRESGAPVEHVSVLSTERRLVRPVSVRALDLTVDDERTAWSGLHDRILRKLAGNGMPIQAIADELNWTVAQVRERARKLGIAIASSA